MSSNNGSTRNKFIWYRSGFIVMWSRRFHVSIYGLAHIMPCYIHMSILVYHNPYWYYWRIRRPGERAPLTNLPISPFEIHFKFNYRITFWIEVSLSQKFREKNYIICPQTVRVFPIVHSTIAHVINSIYIRSGP